jgi:hypothetical protein
VGFLFATNTQIKKILVIIRALVTIFKVLKINRPTKYYSRNYLLSSSQNRPIQMEKLYRFLPYFFVVLLIFVVFCFYQSYFGHFSDFRNAINPITNLPALITNITHFHVTMVMLWILMLIIQPILIIKKKLRYHQILGKASYLMVPLIILSFYLITRQEQLRVKHLDVFAATLFDFLLFVAYYGLAIYFRKKTAYHARFMILTMLTLLDPAFARINIEVLPIHFVLWLIFFGIEFFNQKIYKPYVIGFAYYLFNLGLISYLFMINQPLLDKIWQVLF